MKKIPNIPDAFKDLPDNAKISIKEISALFGLKNTNNISYYCASGNIPDPDVSLNNVMSGYKVKRRFWKLGTIRKWRELAIEESNKQ